MRQTYLIGCIGINRSNGNTNATNTANTRITCVLYAFDAMENATHENLLRLNGWTAEILSHRFAATKCPIDARQLYCGV